MIPKLIAKFTNSLALGITSSSAGMVLSSTVARDGQTIPDGLYGFVIDRGQDNEEFCIGNYSAGTVTFTARGLSYLDGITEIPANKKDHRKGNPVEMTTHPTLTYIAKMLAGDVDLDGILKYPAGRLINQQRQLVDKEYADNIVSSQITSLKVSADGALTVAVNSGYYSLNGVITYYAGSAGNALTDDAVNYVEMNDGALSINTSGFTEGAMPLAKITTASGAITINEDARAILGWLDIKTNSGIGRDSTGLFVDLATDPGLEFSSGKLRAKLDPAGGLTRTAAGLGIGSTSVVVSTTLGESITVSGTPLPVFIGEGSSNSLEYPQRGYDYNKHYTTDNIDAYGVNQIMLVFKTGKYQTRLKAVKARFCKTGTPPGNAVFNLYLADSNSKPTGSSLATVTMTASDLPSTADYLTPTTITFPSVVSVSKDQAYCLVVTAISASTSSNCVSLRYNTSASGEAYSIGTSPDSGLNWSVSSGRYSGVAVIGYSDYEEGKLYLSDFTEDSRSRMNGYLTETKAFGESYSLQVNGSLSGFSSLVTGSDYFLNTIKNAETISYTSHDGSEAFGRVSGYTRVGQTITTSNLLYPNRITFRVYRVGSPTDTVVCKIYDSVGGTLLVTSEAKDLSAITTSTTGEDVTFTFPDIKLSPSTQYFFELERTGTTSDVNHYGCRYKYSASYTGGAAYLDRTMYSLNDLYFVLSMGYSSFTRDVSSGLYLGKALSPSSLLLDDFRGMIKMVSESGSYTYGTTTKSFTVPLLSRKAKINFSYTASSYTFKSQLEVERGESVEWTDYFGSSSYTFNISWVGDTITVTTYNTSGASWTATLYYYN